MQLRGGSEGVCHVCHDGIMLPSLCNSLKNRSGLPLEFRDSRGEEQKAITISLAEAILKLQNPCRH